MRIKTSKLVKKLFIDAEVTGYEVAEKIGTTPQNLYKKISKGTISVADLLEICEVLEMEVKFIKKKLM